MTSSEEWHTRYPRQRYYIRARRQSFRPNPITSQINPLPWFPLPNRPPQPQPSLPFHSIHNLPHHLRYPPISPPNWSHSRHMSQRLLYLPPVNNAIINNPAPMMRPPQNHLPPFRYSGWPIVGNHPSHLPVAHRKPKPILLYLVPLINRRPLTTTQYPSRYPNGISTNIPRRLIHKPVPAISMINKYFPNSFAPTMITPTMPTSFPYSTPTNNLNGIINKTPDEQLPLTSSHQINNMNGAANQSLIVPTLPSNETATNPMPNVTLSEEILNQTLNERPAQLHVTFVDNNMTITPIVPEVTNKSSTPMKRNVLVANSPQIVQNQKKVNEINDTGDHFATTEILATTEIISNSNIPEDLEVNLTTSTAVNLVDEPLNDPDFNLTFNYSSDTNNSSNNPEEELKRSANHFPDGVTESVKLINRFSNSANNTNKNKRSHSNVKRAKPKAVPATTNTTSEIRIRLEKDLDSKEDITYETEDTTFETEDDFNDDYNDGTEAEDYNKSTDYDDYEYWTDDPLEPSTASGEMLPSKKLTNSKRDSDDFEDESEGNLSLFDDHVAEPKKIEKLKNSKELSINKDPNEEEVYEQNDGWKRSGKLYEDSIHTDHYHNEEDRELVTPSFNPDDDGQDMDLDNLEATSADVYESGLFDGQDINSGNHPNDYRQENKVIKRNATN
ncbi:hypothetical protein CHUAL_002387 [Chamberlinius hualienensis]